MCCILFYPCVLEVAQKLCNKIAIIKQGKIVASGTTEELVKDQSLEVFMRLLRAGKALTGGEVT